MTRRWPQYTNDGLMTRRWPRTTLQRVLQAPNGKGAGPAPEGAGKDKHARNENPRHPRCKAKGEVLESTLQKFLQAPKVQGGNPVPEGTGKGKAARHKKPPRPRCKAKEEGLESTPASPTRQKRKAKAAERQMSRVRKDHQTGEYTILAPAAVTAAQKSQCRVEKEGVSSRSGWD